MTTANRPPIDVSAWIGHYPFRDIPHPDPEVLVRVLEREGYGGAWVGHLPGAFHRDVAPSNRSLYAALKPHRSLLHPAPMVRPDWPGWERELDTAVNEGAAAIRIYPAQWALGPSHPAIQELTSACAGVGLPLHITVRFEDLRQRHGLDTAGDVSAAFIRSVARQQPTATGAHAVVVVAGAGRELIEEVHWGLTPHEQARVFYDFHWVWGPPDHHFSHLVRTLGTSRLAHSSWWPLRLTQQSRALISLLPDDVYSPGIASEFADGHDIGILARKMCDQGVT
jgi:hypothetical protein